MADRRRRRRRASQDSEDEDESGSGSDSGRSDSPSTKTRSREPEPAEATAERTVPKSGQRSPKSDEESECESEDGVGEAVLSDYDSADPEDNASHSEGGEEEETFTEETTTTSSATAAQQEVTKAPPTETTPPADEESDCKEENKTEDKSNVTGERQSGDGQESTEHPETKSGGKQKLDDDEDRKNPAYIPRKGLFFEHDLRGANAGGGEEEQVSDDEGGGRGGGRGGAGECKVGGERRAEASVSPGESSSRCSSSHVSSSHVPPHMFLLTCSFTCSSHVPPQQVFMMWSCVSELQCLQAESSTQRWRDSDRPVRSWQNSAPTEPLLKPRLLRLSARAQWPVPAVGRDQLKQSQTLLVSPTESVPEPAPTMHLGVMEGHYYEPMSFQGPMYAHGDSPAPLPPQGMLVQPEMHLPHPGLHPHQSGAPITNPALYGAPPVSLSPGQPQPLLPPPFYPPPGVMTFPYPAMYPTPQAQTQVTYGGVTYYDTVQQQAQPKPSPPRRTSQPVTVKAPPRSCPSTLTPRPRAALRLRVSAAPPPPHLSPSLLRTDAQLDLGPQSAGVEDINVDFSASPEASRSGPPSESCDPPVWVSQSSWTCDCNTSVVTAPVRSSSIVPKTSVFMTSLFKHSFHFVSSLMKRDAETLCCLSGPSAVKRLKLSQHLKLNVCTNSANNKHESGRVGDQLHYRRR
ncbi:hypothetical protein WMY93_031961 [Mugilogobius chulae]|uniref:Protein CASC3 n=1 Tax=Mugilogobius chulae TaxID=88201 RepID=A0AAW0MF88_9GOBI